MRLQYWTWRDWCRSNYSLGTRSWACGERVIQSLSAVLSSRRDTLCVLGCGVIVPGWSFWLLDSSVWLKGWCECWSPVLIISNLSSVVALQMSWTLPQAENKETFGLVKCSLQPVLFLPGPAPSESPYMDGHKQRTMLFGEKQPSSSTLLHFELHPQMLAALGMVPVTPAQAISPSFHPALRGLVQFGIWFGCPCSAPRWEKVSSQRWRLRGAAGTKEEGTGQEWLCFDLGGAMPQGHCSHPPVTPLLTCALRGCLWHTVVDQLDMRPCLKMLWAPLEQAWTQRVPGSVIMLCAPRGALLENGEGAQKLFKWGGQMDIGPLLLPKMSLRGEGEKMNL